MNIDPSIVSALPAPSGIQFQKSSPHSHSHPEFLDPSILSAVPVGGKVSKVETKDTKFLDPCVVAAQPITSGSLPQKSPVQFSMQQISTGQQERALPTAQLSPSLQPRTIQNLLSSVQPPAPPPAPTPPSVPTQSTLSLEIAQQQLQQQQQLARIIQMHRQQPQIIAQPAFIPALQQVQLQQLLAQQQQANLLQSQQLLLQQQTQQLQAQRQQQLLMQQQLPTALSAQQLLMYDQQQLAQLHPQQLQQLHQQLQQQIQLQLQQQHLSEATSPQKLSTANGMPVERGVFGFPPGVSGLPQQLGISMQASAGAAAATQSPAATPAADGAVSAFLPMGTGMGFINSASPAPEQPRSERQQRPRRTLMDQQSRQQEQQQLQFYAAQESSFERPVEVEKSPLPVRRPTKALEIVDPKTNQAIQLAPASSTVADGKPESHESPARANSISKAIPIIDPKTNEPIIEVAKPETETSHSTEATVNDPYSATESPAKEEEKPELASGQENLS